MRFPSHIRRPVAVALFSSGGASASSGPSGPGNQDIPVITDPSNPIFGDDAVWDPYDAYNGGDPVIGGDLGFRGVVTVNWDAPWMAKPNYVPGFVGEDTLDSYSIGASLSALAGGFYWSDAYVVHPSVPTFYGNETFNDYSDSSNVNALSLGEFWSDVFASRSGYVPYLLGMESFNSPADSTDVNGISGDSGWAGNWVAR